MTHKSMQLIVRHGTIALVAFAALFSPATARADLIAFDFSAAVSPTSGTTPNNDIGFEFVPTTNITVTSLLLWNLANPDFRTFDGDVAIWSVANPSTPIVSGAITAAGSPTVASAYTLGGKWRAVDVPDTVLLAGATYRIAGDGFGGATPSDFFASGVTPVPNSDITVTGYYDASAGPTPGPDYPASQLFNSTFPGIPPVMPVGSVSFTYTVVPEPSAATLAVVGGVLMLWWRKRRR